MKVEERIAVLVELAQAWRDPDYAPRAEAVEAMLEEEARFTEEGLAFALNHRMHQLSGEPVHIWLKDDDDVEPRTVGITPATLDPLGGLTAAAAALVYGHSVILEAPTPLVAAFIDELADALDGAVHTASRAALLDASDAWIVAYRAEEATNVETDLESTTLPDSNIEAVEIGESAVVLDGSEDHEVLSALAEDLLLHEGLAPGTPRIVWVPTGTAPEALLNALAGFRELYPAHPDTEGTLALPTAFLVASEQPHATGPGFLVSLGEPEAQTPAHIRWAEYADLGEVERWALAQQGTLSRLIASQGLRDRINSSVATAAPGDAHRPDLDRKVPAFLRSL